MDRNTLEEGTLAAVGAGSSLEEEGNLLAEEEGIPLVVDRPEVEGNLLVGEGNLLPVDLDKEEGTLPVPEGSHSSHPMEELYQSL